MVIINQIDIKSIQNYLLRVVKQNYIIRVMLVLNFDKLIELLARCEYYLPLCRRTFPNGGGCGYAYVILFHMHTGDKSLPEDQENETNETHSTALP